MTNLDDDLIAVKRLLASRCDCLDESDWHCIARVTHAAHMAATLLLMVRRDGPTTLFCMEADDFLRLNGFEKNG